MRGERTAGRSFLGSQLAPGPDYLVPGTLRCRRNGPGGDPQGSPPPPRRHPSPHSALRLRRHGVVPWRLCARGLQLTCPEPGVRAAGTGGRGACQSCRRVPTERRDGDWGTGRPAGRGRSGPAGRRARVGRDPSSLVRSPLDLSPPVSKAGARPARMEGACDAAPCARRKAG